MNERLLRQAVYHIHWCTAELPTYKGLHDSVMFVLRYGGHGELLKCAKLLDRGVALCRDKSKHWNKQKAKAPVVYHDTCEIKFVRYAKQLRNKAKLASF